GIDLDLAAKLLPWHSRLRFTMLTHLHLHAASRRRYADKAVHAKSRKMSTLGFRGLIDSLETAVKRLTWKPGSTEWGDYYTDTNYSAQAMRQKEKRVSDYLDQVRPKVVWDLGANDGRFSRIATGKGAFTVSFDIDPAAVENNFRQCSKNGDANLLPLVLDLTNPSSGIGWENTERQSLIERGPADCVMALALIHHLAISNNLPLNRIAAFLARLGRNLIIEWVPKTDSQVQRLLATREDIFPNYIQTSFEECFGQYFTISQSQSIIESDRTLYLMEKK
ncbi:MAG: SAM-dependent methyltransferase, partial [Planctomycetes bacterium]|nr:SAM-dependent methyltransferase [Planctomycetota bacterium]